MSSVDEQWMAYALRLAMRATTNLFPTPRVGAVIVHHGAVISTGYHRGPGSDHAEVDALKKLDGQCEGATLYVNLEPCSHTGHTPPCTDAILNSGINRVVIGVIDPNPKVNGNGINILREAGIEVVNNVLKSECSVLNRGFFRGIQSQRPFITLKSAVTLDGKVATSTGLSKWITSPASRQRGHELRRDHDAISVGIGTILADDPSLTCRHVDNARDPIRIVFDSTFKTPPSAKVLSDGPCHILGESPASVSDYTKPDIEARISNLVSVGAIPHYIDKGLGNPHQHRSKSNQKSLIDLDRALTQISAIGVHQLLVEGGPTLNSSFYHAGYFDQIVLFFASKIAADKHAFAAFVGLSKNIKNCRSSESPQRTETPPNDVIGSSDHLEQPYTNQSLPWTDPNQHPLRLDKVEQIDNDLMIVLKKKNDL